MYPVLLNLTDRPVLVVGGGKVAARKIKSLLDERALVTVISPVLHEDIPQNKVIWQKRSYRAGDTKDFALVFACTNDKTINEQIMQEASVMQQWVNNAGDKTHSHFYNMKVVKIDEFMISVSSLGRDVKATKELGDRIQQWLEVDMISGDKHENP